MSGADAETSSERVHAFFQTTLINQPQSARDRCRSAHPRRRAGRTLWTATQARAEPGLGCGCGVREIAYVFFFRGSRGTDRPAINARGQHANEELSIKTRVARESRP